MATLDPQHDTEGRSATILPGVPLPEWALPTGPVAPEPELTQEAPPAPPQAEPAPEPEPELVLAGAPAREAEVEATPPPAPYTGAPAPYDLPPAPYDLPPAPYAPALSIGGNGPGPMRAGWDYPGSDFRELAHDEALAEALDAADEALIDDAPVLAPPAPLVDPVLAAALTAPVPQLEPLPAPEPGTGTDAEPVDTRPDEAGLPGDLEVAADVLPRTESTSDAGSDSDDSEAAGDSPSSSRSLVALAALGAVVVAGAVAAFVWPGLLVATDPAPAPVTPSVSAPPTQVALSTPASVGAYTKLDGAPASALTAAVSGSTLPGLSAPVSAVYGTGATPAVTVIAWSSAPPAGAASIPAAFAGFQGATSAVVTDITSTPVSAAGQMRCGTTVVSGVPASLCFWADEATFGSVTVLEPSSPESAADTAVAVRAAVVGG